MRALLAALLSAAFAFSAPAKAQDWPARQITIVVPFGAGGSADLLARILATHMQESFGKPVVVENKPGAGTLVGAELVARSPADGYTLLMATSTTLGISPAMYSKPAIDPVKDFAPVSLVGSVNFFLVTSPSFPPKDVREFVDLVKKNPGKFNYASSGSGSPHHLFMEVLKKEQGLDIQHVPYKGSAAAVLDIIGGKPEAMFLDFSVAVPNIKAGKIHALGTSASKQSVLMPEVPPIAATLPGFDWQAWQGVVTTGGTPPAIVARLNAEMQRFQNTEEFRALLFRFGMEPWGPNSSEQFGEIIRTDMGRWAAVVKASGAKVD
jgi:tripartite-type tricarboxylate transporter receptor subunit TctC